MVDPDDGQAPQARPPGVEDLIDLCRRLNLEGARYIVIGGMAIIQAGFVRATEDIDLLIDDVRIPFANAELLWRTKQTPRDKDQEDRVFLAQLLRR